MKPVNFFGSRYWDLFEKRITETVNSNILGVLPPLRRLSVHLTNKCNLNCSYCNEKHSPNEMSSDIFQKLVKEYSEIGGGVLHITGGEPTCVKYLEDSIYYSALFPNVDLHLNTNMTQMLPLRCYSFIKRLKVSLDSHNSKYFDNLVGRKNSYQTVINNLVKIDTLPKELRPLVSITYTITKENYKTIPEFLKMYYGTFIHFYAVFFSLYKGNNPRFVLDENDERYFFENIVPKMNDIWKTMGDKESKALFEGSYFNGCFDNKERFPENKEVPCYINLSELTINENGDIWNCSHLFRDGVGQVKSLNIKDMHLKDVFKQAKKNVSLFLSDKCLYGCNKKLITFNEMVVKEINRRKDEH